MFKPFSSKADHFPQRTPLAPREDFRSRRAELAQTERPISVTSSPAKLLPSLQTDLRSCRRDVATCPAGTDGVKWKCLAPAIDDSLSMSRGTLNSGPGRPSRSSCPVRRRLISDFLKVCRMRFALRTLVPVFAAVVVLTITTAFWPQLGSLKLQPRNRRSGTSKRRSRRAGRCH